MAVIGKKISESAATVLKKVASEDISALRLVVATSETNIKLADKDLYEDSKVLGLSITSGLTGENVKIITFGQVKDSFFTFTLNEPLYLGDNGIISQSPALLGFSTTIGHGLGNGAIFIDIQEPIEIC